MTQMPEACTHALTALEHDPLDVSPEVLRHLQTCPACAEARVLWLAQEEVPPVLAPAGYFEALPDRIQRKLPAPRRTESRWRRAPLATAAAILLAIAGVGGYLAGRANRTPLVEASIPKAPSEGTEVPAETPFQNGDDELQQLLTLSPEEAKALVEHLKQASSSRH